jgi:hypothetical protein
VEVLWWFVSIIKSVVDVYGAKVKEGECRS